MIAHDYQGRSNKKLLSGFMLFAVSLTLMLLTAESVLRLAYPRNEHDNLFCYHATYGWEFCHDTVGRVITADYSHLLRTDNNGLRDFGKLDVQKRNIVVLGDSFTSNTGVADPSDVFTQVLQERLDGYNVINFGVNGYGTTQEYLKLQKEGMKYNPEIVLIIYYIRNDFHDNMGWLDWVKKYDRPIFAVGETGLTLVNLPVPRKRATIKDVVLRNSYLAAFSRETLLRTNIGQYLREFIGASAPEEQDPWRRIAATPPEILLSSREGEIQEAYERTCKILSLVKTELEQKGVEFYLVIAPSIYQVRDDYFEKLEKLGMRELDRFRPNVELFECGERTGLRIIDLTPRIVAIEKAHRQPFLYFPQEHHWTASGNHLVANILYETLMERSEGLRRDLGTF